jgi:hypothetical protein
VPSDIVPLHLPQLHPLQGKEHNNMGLIIRKQVGGRNAWLNLSRSGISGSVRVGPVTFNSRGSWWLRLLRGVGWRGRWR